MFFPEAKVLATRLNFATLTLFLILAAAPITIAPRATAGIFGISIPANYGNWFTNIYRLYLDNQDVIANARQLYVAYLKVSNTIDALEGMSADGKNAFKERWRRHLQVMLEAQVWWHLDAALFEGDNGVNELLQQILGLRFNEDGQVTIVPETIELLGISLAGDQDYWADLFLDTPVPHFPGWLFTGEAFTDKLRDYLFAQEERAFRPFLKELQQEVHERIFQDVLENPTAFLLCAGKDPCWSPFNFGADPNGPQIVWSWEQMLANMYDLDQPLHHPQPLPGELEFGELLLDGYDQYLHRRVCAAVWRAMGRELKDKLKKAQLAFAKRCHDYAAAIADIQYLARFLQDLITPLEDWNPGGGSGMAFATALSILAGGEAKDTGKLESFTGGLIHKKIQIALERTREVKAKLLETGEIFKNLLAQIEEAERKHRRNRQLESLVHTRLPMLQSWSRNPIPPHAYLATPQAFERLSVKIHDRLRGN